MRVPRVWTPSGTAGARRLPVDGFTGDLRRPRSRPASAADQELRTTAVRGGRRWTATSRGRSVGVGTKITGRCVAACGSVPGVTGEPRRSTTRTVWCGGVARAGTTCTRASSTRTMSRHGGLALQPRKTRPRFADKAHYVKTAVARAPLETRLLARPLPGQTSNLSDPVHVAVLSSQRPSYSSERPPACVQRLKTCLSTGDAQ